jgi:hypothetical protein
MIKHYSILAVVFVCTTVPSLQGAAISLVDIFKNVVYTQNSSAAPVTPSGFFANIELTSQNAGDFTSVSVAYPGPGSPATLTQNSPTFFGIGPSFASQAAMNTAVPFGAYHYTATNGAVTNTATLNYTTDAFTSAIPALSAASFNALQGLNPNNALTIAFNSFAPSAAASQGFTFFSIFNASGTLFTDGFLAPGSTSLLLPANTLAANTTYTFELDFSDRINGTDPNGIPTLVGSDVRTDGTFTTGSAGATAPEPTTTALMGYALIAAATITTFRKARTREQKE